jgi:hypothetical protein
LEVDKLIPCKTEDKKKTEKGEKELGGGRKSSRGLLIYEI